MGAVSYTTRMAVVILVACVTLLVGVVLGIIPPTAAAPLAAPAPPAPTYDTCHGLIAHMVKQQYDGQQLYLGVCIRSFEYGASGVYIDGYSASGIFHNGFEVYP